MAPLALDLTLLARRLRKVRELRGYSQTQAQNKTGVPQGMISQYEAFMPANRTPDHRQRGRLPTISNLKRLADGYRCSIDWLVGRTNKMELD